VRKIRPHFASLESVSLTLFYSDMLRDGKNQTIVEEAKCGRILRKSFLRNCEQVRRLRGTLFPSINLHHRPHFASLESVSLTLFYSDMLRDGKNQTIVVSGESQKLPPQLRTGEAPARHVVSQHKPAPSAARTANRLA
jgi:hypothetical protein